MSYESSPWRHRLYTVIFEADTRAGRARLSRRSTSVGDGDLPPKTGLGKFLAGREGHHDDDCGVAI